MKIEKVIVSSDNSHYKDFFIPVKTVWNYFNINVLHIEISDKVKTEIIEDCSYVIPEIKGIKSSLQAQISRIYAIKKYSNCNILISDIDMIPINIRYFKDNARKLLNNQILFYSGQPYGIDDKKFPMCYILGNSNVLKDFFKLDLFQTFEEFTNYLVIKYNEGWCTDELYVYDCYLNYKDNQNCIINENRNFYDRIDRTHNSYNFKKIYNGYYKDAHLLRPYTQYKTKIDGLINNIIKIPERIVMIGPWLGEEQYELQWIEFIKNYLKCFIYDKLIIGCRTGTEYKYKDLNPEIFLNINISGIQNRNLINNNIPRFQLNSNNIQKKIIQINPEDEFFNEFKNYNIKKRDNNMKKILILILSTKEDEELQNAIRNTWAAQKNVPENIKIKFYYGSKNNNQSEIIDENDSMFSTYKENFENILYKTFEIFKYVFNNYDFDYIFRCCNGCYMNLKLLNNWINSKSICNVYDGIVGQYENYYFCSGSGYLLSKDLLEKIINYNEINYNIPDDVEIGRILHCLGKNPDNTAKRYDIYEGQSFHCNDLTYYHYHFRKHPDYMYKINNLICGNK